MVVKTVKPRKKWWRFWRRDKPIEPELWIVEVKYGKWTNTFYYGNKSSNVVYTQSKTEADIVNQKKNEIYLIIGKGDLVIGDKTIVKGDTDGNFMVYGKIESGKFEKIGKKLGERIIDLKGNESLYLSSQT
jgi:hypothetical protein